MAGIDKIYGTQEQYIEFKDWLNKNRPSAVKYLYDFLYEYKSQERPISNFPKKTDMWLLKNCPLVWVIDRIKYQHGIR